LTEVSGQLEGQAASPPVPIG